MLNEAISAKNLSINEIVDFLEITVKYCNYYKELYEKIPKKERANQKDKKMCVLFDSDLIDDLITTAITINSIINNIAGVILLNRIGTNPLEHHCGLIRLMCHFRHDFEKFVREEQKIKILDEIKQITIGNIITHRKETYGEIVITSDCPNGEESLFTKDDIAISALWKLGFPISKIKKKSNCYNEIAYSNFLQKIKKAKNMHKLSNHKYLLNSYDFKHGSSSGAYIKQRLESLKMNKKVFQEIIPKFNFLFYFYQLTAFYHLSHESNIYMFGLAGRIISLRISLSPNIRNQAPRTSLKFVGNGPLGLRRFAPNHLWKTKLCLAEAL